MMKHTDWVGLKREYAKRIFKVGDFYENFYN